MTQRHRLSGRRRRRLLKKLECSFEFGDDLTPREEASPIEHLEDQPLGIEKAGYKIGKNRI
ncbi:MAG TPA: hypothetical protein VLE23_08725 [Geminicoccaceae bacterium]|nr:hypothetical protein [Geminicoccaceae bacterium]